MEGMDTLSLEAGAIVSPHVVAAADGFILQWFDVTLCRVRPVGFDPFFRTMADWRATRPP